MNWTGCGRKWLWLNLGLYSGIAWKDKRSAKILRIVDVQLKFEPSTPWT
jgi:hypothetical protein